MTSWCLSRLQEPELMDDPDLAEGEHLQALAALGRINLLSRTAAQISAAIARGPRPTGDEPLVVADIACGGGDVTVGVAARLARDHRFGAVRVIGVDKSDRAISRCRLLAAGRTTNAEFAVRDVVADGCPACDVAVSSLFLHHLDDAAATRLLASMAAAARLGIVVSDLLRSRVGLALAALGTTCMTRSRVARVDGPRSVRAARTRGEYGRLCSAVGLHGAQVRRVWPQRVLCVWWRAAAGGEKRLA